MSAEKGAPAISRRHNLSVSASPLPVSSRRDWKKIYQDDILGLDACTLVSVAVD
jgi:hypothetical protein